MALKKELRIKKEDAAPSFQLNENTHHFIVYNCFIYSLPILINDFSCWLARSYRIDEE